MAKKKPAPAPAPSPSPPAKPEAYTLSNLLGFGGEPIHRADGTLLGHVRGVQDFESMVTLGEADALGVRIMGFIKEIEACYAEGQAPPVEKVESYERDIDRLLEIAFEPAELAEGVRPPTMFEKQEIAGRFFARLQSMRPIGRLTPSGPAAPAGVTRSPTSGRSPAGSRRPSGARRSTG